MKIAIVTDSTADIPQQQVDQYGIQVMNNYIMIGSQTYTDNVDITREEFYQMLPKMTQAPTTGTASGGLYMSMYGELLKQGFTHIVSIHPSALLSGILNAASSAAESFDNRVRLIDGGQISMGLGFQVLAAAEAAANGLDIDQVVQCVESVRSRVKLVAMLDTMEYIRRSGRVSWAKASLGSLLSIKPFIELREGKVISLGNIRTRHKGLEHLIELYHKLGKFERLAILHSNAEEEARIFAGRLDLDPSVAPLFVNVTTVIGSHVGPGALGFTGVLAGEAAKQ